MTTSSTRSCACSASTIRASATSTGSTTSSFAACCDCAGWSRASRYAEAFTCRKLSPRARMIFRETTIDGVWVVEPERYEDERGFFARTWDSEEFAQRGLPDLVVQTSISYNRRRGTLRGLHYQAAPHEEAKLVRCTSGAIFDVAVDLRLASRRRSDAGSVSSSRPRTGTLCTCPRAVPMAFSRSRTTSEVALPDVGPPCPRSRPRRSLRRPRVRDRVAGGASW